MSNDGPLFDAPPPQPPAPPRLKGGKMFSNWRRGSDHIDPSSAAKIEVEKQIGRPISVRFEEFHAENPHVYVFLLRFAREAKATGKRRIGIRMVWERMRWELMITTRDEAGWKLNDHYTSRYARLLMDEPGLEELFEIRELRSD